MMFYEIILKLIILNILYVRSLSQGVMDNIFYGENFVGKDIELKKLKDQLESAKLDIITITNLERYKKKNFTNMIKIHEIVRKRGKCNKFISLKDTMNSKSNFTENINLLRRSLNDKNYVFNDVEGNLLTYSTCSNFIDASCIPQMLFVSKLDFSFFKYSFSNEVIGFLANTALDLTHDRYKQKDVLYLFGGIDRTGKHNSHLYKFEIDDTFGQVQVQKIGSISQTIPGGRAEASLNILNYKSNLLSKDPNREMILIFGGVNDISTLNDFWVYRADAHTWALIENKIEHILPRKGHSAVLFNNHTDENINPEIMMSYNLIIFGGKNDYGYINDIFIIDISYMVLEDRFFFNFRTVDISSIVEPEKREGHKAVIKGDYMYIFGGCNYEIKKCYNDIYRISLKNTKAWEKVEYNTNKEKSNNDVQINPENSFFADYMGDFVTFSNCNKDNCSNKDISMLILNNDCAFNKCKDTSLVFDFKRNPIIQLPSVVKEKSHRFGEDVEIKKTKVPKKSSIEKIKQLVQDFDVIYNNVTFVCDETKKKLDIVKNNIKKKDEKKKNEKKNKTKKNDKDKKEKKNEKGSKNEKVAPPKDKKNEIKDHKDKKDDKKDHKDHKDKKEHKDKKDDKKDHKDHKDKKEHKDKKDEKKDHKDHKDKKEHKDKKDEKKDHKDHKDKKDEKKDHKDKKEGKKDHKDHKDKKDEKKDHQKNDTNKTNKTEIHHRRKEKHLEHLMKVNIMSVLQSMMKNNMNHLVLKNNKSKGIDLFDDQGFSFIQQGNTAQRIKAHEEEIKAKQEKEKQEKELKLIISSLFHIQKHLASLEKSTVNNRNNFEAAKKSQMASNYMLQSNLDKTDLISNNIRKFKDEYLDKFSKNFSLSMQENFKTISGKINKLDELNQRITLLQRTAMITQKINDERMKCNNGIYQRSLRKCICDAGFIGVHCQNRMPCQNNCSSNGICSLGKCYCNPNFQGKTCNITINCSNSNNCSNKGKCQYGKCFCDAGFTGSDCSKKLKCPNNCNNKGICFREKCLCSPGWGGKDCSILKVEFKPCYNDCNGNGICKLEKCFCYPGFGGKYCNEKLEFNCPPIISGNQLNKNTTWTPCNNNGLCKFGMCFCFPGFKGDDCGIKEMCKNNCSYNGICVKDTCICKEPFIGDDCHINKTEEFFQLNSRKNNLLHTKKAESSLNDNFMSFAELNETVISKKHNVFKDNVIEHKIVDHFSLNSLIAMFMLIIVGVLVVIFSFLLCNNLYLKQ